MRVRGDLCHAMLQAGEEQRVIETCTDAEAPVLESGAKACFFPLAVPPNMYNDRGVALANAERMDEAKLEFGRAIGKSLEMLRGDDARYSPRQHADALNNMGAAHFQQSDMQSALRLFEDALAIMPAHARARANLLQLVEDSQPVPLR
jgi:tetratricopeptide (TPR) repeat protein